jgi:enoyl-CoA hydratase/carnithine racemase
MTVRFDVTDHVATVTLARPDVMNAIDPVTEAELQRIWSDLEQRRDVRVIVLTGDGERAFCAGADMKSPSRSPTLKGVDYWAAARPGGFGGIALRETLNIPVIARVNGYALGGGFEMVLGCDIVVACEEASFGLPEPLVGRMPLDGGMTLLQRQIPYRLAMGMLLTGQRIKAQRAFEIGLVNEVVPRAELDAAVARWVGQILACAPLSLQAIKQVVRATGSMPPGQAQALRLPALVAALQSEDADEGVKAFQENASRGGRATDPAIASIDRAREHPDSVQRYANAFASSPSSVVSLSASSRCMFSRILSR